MKQLILMMFLILLFSGVLKAQQQVVKYPTYTSYYNTKLLIPDSCIWVCTPHKKTVGREAEFHASSGHINVSRDYAHSGYDLGHLDDASDNNMDGVDEYNSFDLVNVFPQKPNLNRKTWLALENYTRALNQPVRVKVSWIGINGYLGTDKVAIPEYCVKELWYKGKYEKYCMPNQDSVSRHQFTYYRIK